MRKSTRWSTVLAGVLSGSNRESKKAASRRLAHSVHFAVEQLESRTLLSAVVWTGDAGDGNWDTAGNWTGGSGVPGSSDDVTIPSNATITHPDGNNDTVNSIVCGTGDSISLSSGSITISSAPPSPATTNTLNNFLTVRHNKNSDATFADGHSAAVSQMYATNLMYLDPVF